MSPPGSDPESRRRWKPAYIGIGSNLDDPAAQVERAIAAIGGLEDCWLGPRSSKYRSRPLGPPGQPDFINAVVAVLTTLGARELLERLQAIERRQGRDRPGERWGPRTLDLDLLVYGSDIIDEAKLTVPHPRIGERNFVLLPLRDIAPQLEIPGLGTVAALAEKIDDAPPAIAKLST